MRERFTRAPSTLKDNTHFDTESQLTRGGEMAKLMPSALAKAER